jgi:NADP-dependent 3-hydroxy acid dehydrogenase YdfG
VLVNNAGGAHGLDPVERGLDADWETMFQANVLGTLRMTRDAPLMKTQPEDHHQHRSVAGREAYEGGAACCAAKAGVCRSPECSASN